MSEKYTKRPVTVTDIDYENVPAERLAAVARAVLAVLPEPQPDPEDPYSIDPIDYDSTKDVIEEAVSRGWTKGEQNLADVIRAAMATAWEEQR